VRARASFSFFRPRRARAAGAGAGESAMNSFYGASQASVSGVTFESDSYGGALKREDSAGGASQKAGLRVRRAPRICAAAAARRRSWPPRR